MRSNMKAISFIVVAIVIALSMTLGLVHVFTELSPKPVQAAPAAKMLPAQARDINLPDTQDLHLSHKDTAGSQPEPGGAPEDLNQREWEALQAKMQRAQYQFTWQVRENKETGHIPGAACPQGAYHAPNHAQNLDVALSRTGLAATRYNAHNEQSWSLGLRLMAYGEQRLPDIIAKEALNGSRERVTYNWDARVTEWYENRPDGLKHGLTLAAPPTDKASNTITLTFALSGDLTPDLNATGQGLLLRDADGHVALRYNHLGVTDAEGRVLPAWLELEKRETSNVKRQTSSVKRETSSVKRQASNVKRQASSVKDILSHITHHASRLTHHVSRITPHPPTTSHTFQIVIETTDATYPITVDPLLHSENIILRASDRQEEDFFATSVAIDGDTLVIGAPYEDGGAGDTITDTGAVYVFTRNQGGADAWGEVTILRASDSQAEDHFGNAVSISADTIIIGADNESGGVGAAYVFARNQGGPDNWGEVKILHASDAQASDTFGDSVSINDDTAVVGAPHEDGGAGDTITDTGAVYVFTRNQGGPDNWGEVKILHASDAQAYDAFGKSMSLHSNTLIVGSLYEDGGVGDPITNTGAAYVFARNQGSINNWGEVTILRASDGQPEDRFGASVDFNDDVAVVGAYFEDGGAGDPITDTGAAYVFARNQGGADNWGQIKILRASDAQAADYFGNSVSLSGDTLIVSALSENGGTGTPITDAGAVYAYARNQGGADNWGQIAILRASDAQAYDYFGNSVSFDGDTLVIGAYLENGGAGNLAFNSGAVYIFTREDGAWQEAVPLQSSDIQTGDQFGWSISLDGDTLVVGAPGEDGGAGSLLTSTGTAYIFTRNYGGADVWGEAKILRASDGQAYDRFGTSVSLSGDTVVVGAHVEDGGAGDPITDTGAAYVFTRNQGGADNWGEVAILKASDGQPDDRFGEELSLDGNIVVVGAYLEDGGAGDSITDTGAAYVFARNQGGIDAWGQVTILQASDAQAGDWFGSSLSISGDTIIVGALLEDGGAGDPTEDTGAVYVFTRNQGGADNWGEVTVLHTSDAQALDWFGSSMDIDGDTVIVGACGEDGGTRNPRQNAGAAYVFARNQGGADNWGEVTILRASYAQDSDFFGDDVSLSDDTVIVGADREDGGWGDPVANAGTAYVFERNQGGTDNWGQVSILRASDKQADDRFGSSIGFSEDTIVVGTFLKDGSAGKAYIFRLTEIVSPTALTLTGPTTGLIGTDYTFTATASPLSTTHPLAFVWKVGETVVQSHTSGLSNTATINWAMPGTYTLTVAASNKGGTVAETHNITIDYEPERWTSTGGPLVQRAHINALNIGYMYDADQILQPTSTLYTVAGLLGNGEDPSLYKSTNNGASWTKMSAFTNSWMSTLAVSSIYTSTWGGRYLPHILYAEGAAGEIHKSSDGGATWNTVFTGTESSPYTPAIYALATGPLTSSVVYAGGRELDWADGGRRWGVVYHSLDSGATWTKVLTTPAAGSQGAFFALAVNPQNPNIAYAGGGEQQPGSLDFYSVIYKTENGGASWTRIYSATHPWITALAIHPLTPTLVYAGSISNWESSYVLRSEDSGATWTKVLTNAGQHLALVPPSTVYAIGGCGDIFSSTVGGDLGTWTKTTAPKCIQSFAVDATSNNIFYAGTQYNGILKSTDYGTTWAESNAGIQTLVWPHDIDVAPQNPNKVFIAAHRGGGWMTTDGQYAQPLGLANCINTFAINPDDPNIVYGGADDDTHGAVLRSEDGGLTFTPVYTAASIMLSGGNEQIFDLAIAPSLTSTIYAVGEDYRPTWENDHAVVLRSLNDGVSWTEVFTLPPESHVQVVAIDPTNANTVYIGGRDCSNQCNDFIYRSTNGGNDWTRVFTTPTHSPIRSIVIDAYTPQTLYVSDEGYTIYKSTDSGATWQTIRTCCPSGNQLALDPNDPDHLYMGGYGYIAESTDGGYTWTDDLIDRDTPPISPHALAVNNDTVTQTLYGGFNGMWLYRRAALQPIELNTLSIAGPTTGLVNAQHTFTVTANPTATTPIVYEWHLDSVLGQQTITHTTSYHTDVITAQWTTDGMHTITVTASNAVNTKTATHTIILGAAGYTLYHPNFYNSFYGTKSTLYVQNPTDATANVVLTFDDLQGTSVPLNFSIDPQATLVAPAESLEGLSDSTLYTLILMSDQPVHSVVREQTSSTTGDTLSMYRGYTTPSYDEYAAPFYKAYNDINSGVVIWNVSQETANVQIDVYDLQGTVAHTDQQTLTPGAEYTLLPMMTSLSDAFVGWVSVSADQAVVVQMLHSSTSNSLREYRTHSGNTSTTLRLPRAFKAVDEGNGARTTTLFAVSTETEANATLTYYEGVTLAHTSAFTLSALGAQSINLADEAALSGGGTWAVHLSGDQTLLLDEVTTFDTAAQPVGTYGTKVGLSLALPYLVSNDTAHTVFSLQNLGTDNATATVSYYNTGGTLILTETVKLTSGEAVRYNQRDRAGLGDTFVGSAVVEANQPLMAWVDEYVKSTAPPPQPATVLTNVAISGPTNGLLNTAYAFTATVSPITATQPITYVWNGGEAGKRFRKGNMIASTVIFSWTTAGTHTISVTATNISNTVSAPHNVTIISSPTCPYPLRDIATSGPPIGITNTLYTFMGIITPTNATPPLAYTWSPTPDLGQGTINASYLWDTPGAKGITLTVENCGARHSVTHTITLSTNPPEGDAYEIDDACLQARPIPTDGTIQEHTFHDVADSDWMSFYAISGTEYLIEAVTPSDSQADVALELYANCGDLPDDDQDHAFSPDVRLRFTAPENGPLYLQARNSYPDQAGPKLTYHLSVRSLAETASQGAVVIVAGRLRLDDTLQRNIHNVTNEVYRLFLEHGYSKDRIYYLATNTSLDADENGHHDDDVDLKSSHDNLKRALTQWATDPSLGLGPDRALTLYLMDHGGVDRFYLDGSSQTVSPEDLDSWLDTLEEAAPGVRINIIMEACHSGSFMETLSQKGRVVIASTATYAVAYATQDGARFSDTFLASLERGLSLYNSFEEARWTAETAHPDQTPWLDDDGDGIWTPTTDGQEAARRGFAYAGTFDPTEEQWPPYIVWTRVDEENGDRVIKAKVEDNHGNNGVNFAWAVIYKPSYSPPPSDTEEMPQENLPTVQLQDLDGDGTWSAIYNFDEVGLYRLVIYAADDEDLDARPKQITVQVGWNVYLPLVLRRG